ncbi:hypothetical protein LU196_02385 [Pantoea sp. Mb-10]|uniref:hypothetical protein n=1 Tax=unclassified Pantoea TaxID=2630326 RepID=UPI001E5F6B13|nr:MULTISPECIES: hypothetical protein [unclassified Pantoea]MCE0488905.1 hypothetical protein [Pantoea sp. Mb-10]MCE0500652.1 hypothetical protein [Pantoea sp. Pb-8]
MRSIIHCTVNENEDDCAVLRAIIQGNILKIAEALAGDLQWYDQNAKLSAESFKIVSIQPLGNNRFKMLYDFRWDLFNACLDLNESVTQREQVSFQVKQDALEFDVIDNTRPSPADEL